MVLVLVEMFKAHLVTIQRKNANPLVLVEMFKAHLVMIQRRSANPYAGKTKKGPRLLLEVQA